MWLKMTARLYTTDNVMRGACHEIAHVLNHSNENYYYLRQLRREMLDVLGDNKNE